MDFKQLQYMIAIADSQNITKASEQLFISRSALNYSLLKLEDEIGLPLFKRINNTMIPTAAGKVYLDHARQILQLSKNCRTVLRDMVDCERGSLSLGITPGYGQTMFSVVFPEFNRNFPKYDVNLIEENVRVLYNYLLEGRIDFAWSGFHREVAGLEHVTFRSEDVYLAVPRSKCRSPLADAVIQPTPADLSLYRSKEFVLMNNNSLIRDISNIYFENAGFEPRIIFECSKIDMAHAITRQGIALTFVPRGLCRPNPSVVYFPIHPSEQFSIAVSFRKGTYLTKAEQFFIELIKRNYETVLSPSSVPAD